MCVESLERYLVHKRPSIKANFYNHHHGNSKYQCYHSILHQGPSLELVWDLKWRVAVWCTSPLIHSQLPKTPWLVGKL